MFHPRNISTVLRGSGGWLAATLLATAAVLIYANLVWAQQTSTEAAVPAPSLTAEADNGTVELNWTAVADAERYELWVWTSADGWQQIGEDNLTDTTYSHTGLTTGTTYYYTVRAVNADGVTGPWSEYASATVTTGQTPTPTQTPTSTAMPLISTTPSPTAMPLISTTPTPTAVPMISTTPTPTPSATAAAALSAPVLSAQVTAADTIDLSWGVVADAARYDLFSWWNADTGWQKLDDGNLTDTTYSHTGLTAGTTYYYTVRTVNAAGETGPWSEYASATVTTGQTPTPTALPMISTTPTPTAMPMISTTPTPAAMPMISTTPTPSAVPLISTTPTPTAVPMISTTPTPTPTVTPTAMPMISTTPTPTPSATAAAALTAPVLAVQVTSANTIDLSWGVVADAARYELFTWWNAETGWQKLDDGNLTDTTYSHTGLTAGTTYYYTVRGVNAAGETGPWSEYASATVTTGETPTPTPTPTAISANTDRLALVALYNATDGANWLKSDNWLTDAPLNDWHGVDTDSTGRVVSLFLYDNQLSGTIPPELGNLTNLEFLNVGTNQLSGTIPPELGNLTNLDILSLATNQLSGTIPPELGRLSNLTELVLATNPLSGTIPPELGNLSNLEVLVLGTNQLSGTIPPELGSLSNLTVLFLFDNQLSGTIPPELGNLTNLTALVLATNQLSGTIPPELGNLTKLRWLYLAENGFTGCIPAGLRNVDRNDLADLGLPDCG